MIRPSSGKNSEQKNSKTKPDFLSHSIFCILCKNWYACYFPACAVCTPARINCYERWSKTKNCISFWSFVCLAFFHFTTGSLNSLDFFFTTKTKVLYSFCYIDINVNPTSAALMYSFWRCALRFILLRRINMTKIFMIMTTLQPAKSVFATACAIVNTHVARTHRHTHEGRLI